MDFEARVETSRQVVLKLFCEFVLYLFMSCCYFLLPPVGLKVKRVEQSHSKAFDIVNGLTSYGCCF